MRMYIFVYIRIHTYIHTYVHIRRDYIDIGVITYFFLVGKKGI